MGVSCESLPVMVALGIISKTPISTWNESPIDGHADFHYVSMFVMYCTCLFFIPNYLRLMKQWICRGRPITIYMYAIGKIWLSKGSRISPQCDITRRQRPMRALVSFTVQRKLCTNMRRTWLLGYSPQTGCSGKPANCVSGGSTIALITLIIP